jgi:hypothetical protein
MADRSSSSRQRPAQIDWLSQACQKGAVSSTSRWSSAGRIARGATSGPASSTTPRIWPCSRLTVLCRLPWPVASCRPNLSSPSSLMRPPAIVESGSDLDVERDPSPHASQHPDDSMLVTGRTGSGRHEVDQFSNPALRQEPGDEDSRVGQVELLRGENADPGGGC